MKLIIVIISIAEKHCYLGYKIDMARDLGVREVALINIQLR